MKTSGKSTQFWIIIVILIKKKIQLTHSLNLMAAVHTLVWWKRSWNEMGMDEVLWLQMKEDEGAIKEKGIFMDETNWLISSNKKCDCGPAKLASLAAAFWPYFDFKTGLCTGTARAVVKRWLKPSSSFACLFPRSLHYKILFSSATMSLRKVSFVLIKLTLANTVSGRQIVWIWILTCCWWKWWFGITERNRGKEEGDSQEGQYGRKDEWWWMNNLVPPFPLSSFSSLLGWWCYKDRRKDRRRKLRDVRTGGGEGRSCKEGGGVEETRRKEERIKRGWKRDATSDENGKETRIRPAVWGPVIINNYN